MTLVNIVMICVFVAKLNLVKIIRPSYFNDLSNYRYTLATTTFMFVAQLGPRLNIKSVFSGMGISMIKIER